MRDPYLDYVRGFEEMLLDGGSLLDAAPVPPVLTQVSDDAPVCLIFSPHPDDEVIAGALPWRLRSEAGWRVINIAVTLGSDVGRRAARWQELARCCAHLGFELRSATGTPGVALERVPPFAAAAGGAQRHVDVDRLSTLIQQYRPRVVVCPHAWDGHPAHIGTHDLVLAALRRAAPHWRLHMLFSEYWNTQLDPALMLPLDRQQVAILVAALGLHTGEVARNPYHLSLPAWFIDSARRGSERVGPAGGPTTGAVFAALYGWSCWQDGGFGPMPAKIAPGGRSMASLFV